MDIYGGGQLVQVLQDPHGVPGVEAAVDEDHVGDIGSEAAVLNVGFGNIAGQLLRGEILPEGISAPTLKDRSYQTGMSITRGLRGLGDDLWHQG